MRIEKKRNLRAKSLPISEVKFREEVEHGVKIWNHIAQWRSFYAFI